MQRNSSSKNTKAERLQHKQEQDPRSVEDEWLCKGRKVQEKEKEVDTLRKKAFHRVMAYRLVLL